MPRFFLSSRLLSLGVLLVAAAFAAPVFARTEFPQAAQPQLALSLTGRLWLAYGQGDGVYVAHSEDQGATFSPTRKIANLPGLALGMRRGPRIAVHGERVTVTVQTDKVLALHSNDSGNTWSGPTTVNDVAGGTGEGLHDLAVAPDGSLFAIWLDNRNGPMELWGAESKDAGRTWGRNQLVYRSPEKSVCECCHPSALFDAAGNLAVMWRNSLAGARDMWMTVRPHGASSFGNAQKLGVGTWPLNACPMDGGRIVALGGGRFGAVWQRAGEVFKVSPDEPEIFVGKGNQPVAFLAPDGIAILWQQGPQLWLQRGAATTAPAKLADEARFASVLALPAAGSAVVAYERGGSKSQSVVVVVRL
jgi:hypothetical protein